jgi:hypothetical protein
MNDITQTVNTPADTENYAGLPDFHVAMLKVGKVLLADSWEVREVTAQRISKIMTRHHFGRYKPKEIRELWEYHHYYIQGANIQIEASEMPIPYRGPRHYLFTFKKHDLDIEVAQIEPEGERNIPASTSHDSLASPMKTACQE